MSCNIVCSIDCRSLSYTIEMFQVFYQLKYPALKTLAGSVSELRGILEKWCRDQGPSTGIFYIWNHFIKIVFGASNGRNNLYIKNELYAQCVADIFRKWGTNLKIPLPLRSLMLSTLHTWRENKFKIVGCFHIGRLLRILANHRKSPLPKFCAMCS